MNIILQKFLKFSHFVTQPFSGVLLHNSQRVRVLVLSEGQILLQRSSFGKQRWSLPGGGIEKHESAPQAAARELEEETGLKVLAAELRELTKVRHPAHKKWPQSNITIFTINLPKMMPVQVKRQFEVLAVGWFKVNNLPEPRSTIVDIALSKMTTESAYRQFAADAIIKST